MYENDETLLGLMDDQTRLLKRITISETLMIATRETQIELEIMEMHLLDLESNREDPDSVLGLEMSIEDNLSERIDENNELLSRNKELMLQLSIHHEELREVHTSLECLIKVLEAMSNGADVALGLQILGDIDFEALQNKCRTKFMEDERLRELIKTRSK